MDDHDEDQLKGHVQYQQAGLIVYGDDDNYTKFDRLATNAPTAAGDREVRVHQRGRGHAAQRQPRTRTANLRRDASRTTSTCGSKSDGTQHHAASTRPTARRGRRSASAAALPANAKIGVFALVQRGGHATSTAEVRLRHARRRPAAAAREPG